VSELIRIGKNGQWDVVVGAARTADGIVKAPVSHLGDGFGNPYNAHFWRMVVYRGALLLGTNDWSWSLNGTPIVNAQIRSEFGFDLFGTCNGNDWWRATDDGFGRPNDFGARTMVASRAGLFLGTANLIQGTTIRQSQAKPCTAASRSAVTRLRRGAGSSLPGRLPRRLMMETDFDTGLSALSQNAGQRLHGKVQR
jgi:hypothetical protein